MNPIQLLFGSARIENQERRTTMAEQVQALQKVRETAPVKPFTADFLARAEEMYGTIAGRAFEIFQDHGGVLGQDLEDWFKAEAEVLHPIHLDLAESDREITARAEVPGFSTNDIEIRLEPHRLAITGERESEEERNGGQRLYSERCAHRVFRVIDLPVEVNPDRTKATLRDGVLEIAMPKATPPRDVRL
jgi:HSP20 family molecular chaperone IbpA